MSEGQSPATAMLAPEAVHRVLIEEGRPQLGFQAGMDTAAWRDALADRLREAVGITPERVAPEVRIEWTQQHDGFTETRFSFLAEAHARVPCHLLVPDGVSTPMPVIVCLQGHTTGMHVSLGRAGVHDPTPVTVEGDRDFARYAIARGYAALVMEQRAFGERADQRSGRQHRAGQSLSPCQHAAYVALMLGRTLIGERVWDVQRALDVLIEDPVLSAGLDSERIGCMGNSHGGTISYYAACLDPRIAAVMPGSAVCTYAASITAVDHCCDNYLPGALRWFEMADLAGLISPRPLVVVAGKQDTIFPLPGVNEAYARISEIYQADQAGDATELYLGEGGHRFYADGWDVFDRVTGWRRT